MSVGDYYSGEELMSKLGLIPIGFVRYIERQLIPYPVDDAGQFRTPTTDPKLYDPKLWDDTQAWGDYVRATRFFKPAIEAILPWTRHMIGDHREDPLKGLSPEEIVQYCHDKGITDPYRITRVIDTYLTGENRLTATQLGELLPANPLRSVSPEGARKRGQRLRKKVA